MKLVKSFALIIFTGLLMLSFQNCSPSQTQSLLGSRSTGASVIETITDEAPFAYDLVMDTISYNSCVGQELNSSGIHGLKIGANEGFVDRTGSGAVKAGLKLRTDFLQYIGKNVTPIYPSTVPTPGQIQYILQNSKANKNAYIQYAVRKRLDLSVIPDLIRPTGTIVPVRGRDGLIEEAALSADPVLTAITKNVQFGEKGLVLSEGPRAYNLYETSAARPIEASLGYSNFADETFSTSDGGSTTEPLGYGEAYADRVRQKFNLTSTEKYLLAVTYGDPSTGDGDYGLNSPKRKLDTDKTKAYGRAYALGFDTASTRAGWRNNLLKTVTETNLVDNTPVTGGTHWSCSSYVIMKQTHWNNAKPTEPACVPMNAVDLQNTTVANNVKALRRHYLEKNWNVGFYYPKNSLYAPATRTTQPLCLVPKDVECYMNTTINGTDIGVNYDTSTECYLYAYSVLGVSYTSASTLDGYRAFGRCAQYASICTRASTNY